MTAVGLRKIWPRARQGLQLLSTLYDARPKLADLRGKGLFARECLHPLPVVVPGCDKTLTTHAQSPSSPRRTAGTSCPEPSTAWHIGA